MKRFQQTIQVSVALVLLFLSSSAISVEYAGQHTFDSYRDQLNKTDDGSETNAVIKVSWKLWTLLGEPVDHAIAKWGFKNNATLKVPVGNWGKRLKHINGFIRVEICKAKAKAKAKHIGAGTYCVPKHIFEKVRITDLHISVKHQLKSFEKLYKYDYDVGIMSKPGFGGKLGKKSFNVNGSKDWGKSFYSGKNDYLSGTRYLSAKKAKEILSKGKQLEPIIIGRGQSDNYAVEIKTIDYDFTPVMSHLLETFKAQKERKIRAKNKKKLNKTKKKVVQKNVSDDPLEALANEEIESFVEDKAQDNLQSEIHALNSEFRGSESALIKLKELKQRKIQLTQTRINSRTLPSRKLEIFKEVYAESYFWCGLGYNKCNTNIYTYGFKNEYGKIIIPAKYVRVRKFKDGKAFVIEGDIKPETHRFDMLAHYVENRKCYFINKKGDKISDYISDEEAVSMGYSISYHPDCDTSKNGWTENI